MITTESIAESYSAVRKRSLSLVAPLEIEDFGVQPMSDASPPKWHLAHVTWFFETFLLKPYLADYQPCHPDYEVLFNSYYNGVGDQFPRSERGNLSRPTVREVMDYRRHVDDAMAKLLVTSTGNETSDIVKRCVLGLNHEQQHQELLLTDLKYNLGHNPLFPVYRPDDYDAPANVQPLEFDDHAGGIHQIGIDLDADAESFCFDNESPRHDVLLQNYRLANRLVTNGEYLAFIEAGGYEDFSLWLSDGWSRRNQAGWKAPLYWHQLEGEWFEYTLGGLQPLNIAAPVCHVSGYEADAYARWRGCRLPTEAEWEVAATGLSIKGNFLDSGLLHPAPAGHGSQQMFGDVWEWTSSSYAPYPGYEPLPGTLGEYNGKFMANQLVLRGGSCATSRNHIRPQYRNFFYPPDRWQFTGIRLGGDAA